MSPFTAPKGATTVKRFCGHLSSFPYPNMCSGCLTALRGSLCAECEGYTKPLRPCVCHRAYLVSEESVKKLCGYCHAPTEIWDLGPVVIGRWGFRLVRQKFDKKGVEEVKRVSALFTRRVEGCKACQGMLDLLRRHTEEGHTAFLPEL